MKRTVNYVKSKSCLSQWVMLQEIYCRNPSSWESSWESNETINRPPLVYSTRPKENHHVCPYMHQFAATCTATYTYTITSYTYE